MSAFPTFQFYKNGTKVDEMRGANARRLEDLIIKHISPIGYLQEANINMKPSPYNNFPLHESNRPVYMKAPFKKMKDKLNQLNTKFIEDEKQSVDNNKESDNKKNYSLNEKEWPSLTQ